MLTRRNRNLGLLKAMHPSSAPATSKIVMQTVTLDLDMSISERIFPTELTNFGPSNPMCSPNWHDLAIKKFSESGPIETEPENDRSTVPPDMWTLYPFVLDFLFSSKTDNGLGNNRLKSCDNRAPQGNNNVQMTNRYDQHAEQGWCLAELFFYNNDAFFRWITFILQLLSSRQNFNNVWRSFPKKNWSRVSKIY